jgi:hypothetical protein
MRVVDELAAQVVRPLMVRADEIADDAVTGRAQARTVRSSSRTMMIESLPISTVKKSPGSAASGSTPT